MKKRFDNKGFSLLELIITIFLVFILFSVAYTILSIGNNNFTRGTAKTHLQQNARILDEYIQTYLRKATNIVVSANEGDKLEYTIEIEGNIANVNSDGLTADVIDEIQIRVDESGDKPILEYIIETSTGEETYQLTNSIVLNNMASDYFAGNFSSFTALGSMALTYNSDMNVILDRSLSVNPDDVEKSISYTGDDYLLFTFTLEGDNFVTGLNAMDAALSGGLSDLDVLDFSWSNDTLAKIRLGNGEVSDVIGTGSITISEDAFEVGGELTVEVNIVEIASIVVTGLSQVSVPEVGEDPIDYTYTSSSFTAEIEEVGCGEVTWSLSDDTLVGVSIDSETGILTITDEAEGGSVNIIAELNSNSTITDQMTVTITVPPEPLSEILATITTLPFMDGYDAYSTPVSYSALPEYEGVTFSWESESVTGGNIEIFDGQSVMKYERHTNSLRVGSVTLQIARDGETLNKVFDIVVPNDNEPIQPITITPVT